MPDEDTSKRSEKLAKVLYHICSVEPIPNIQMNAATILLATLIVTNDVPDETVKQIHAILDTTIELARSELHPPRK